MADCCEPNSSSTGEYWILERRDIHKMFGVNFTYLTLIGVFSTFDLATEAADFDILSRTGEIVQYLIRNPIVDQLYPYGIT